MNSNLEFLIPIAFFGMVYMIFKTVTDNRTRQKLIDKGMVDEKVKYLFTKDLADNPLQSLKWGLVLFGIGLALTLSMIFPTMAEPVIMGMMFLFAGVAFIIYYVLANKKQQQ